MYAYVIRMSRMVYGQVEKNDFHIFTVIYSSLHGFVCNQHNNQLPLSWLVNSDGGALHRYRRGYGFKSRTALNQS